MSRGRLPDNLDQWPDDPFALLGVSHSSSRREVKRAYAQLIRLFKPEQFPEHFRRLRDDYELLDQRLSWMEMNEAESEQVAAFADEGEDADGAESHNEVSADSGPERLKPGSRDRDDLWEKARRGDLAEAYAHYSKLANQGRADDALFVRLFWMLRLTPEIDPLRDPRDWLVAGLKRCGLRGRLPELYRCEVADDPHEALSPRCQAAINCSGHLGLLTELVIARWGGAAKLRKWELIAQDLQALRGRLQDESSIWGRLLLAAIDRLAWATSDGPQETLAKCVAEVEQVAEHLPHIAAELNQRDSLRELVEACDQLKLLTNLPLEWRKSLRSLLLASWNEPLEGFRHALLEVLAPLVHNPLVGLEWLDRLEARCRPAFHRFGTLIVMLAGESGVGQDDTPPDVLLNRLVAFLVAASKCKPVGWWQRWGQAKLARDRSGREELLMFCLQESVTMTILTDVLATSERKDLAKFLAPAGNAPLHLICLAYLAFWA
jgi:hypothetical protein